MNRLIHKKLCIIVLCALTPACALLDDGADDGQRGWQLATESEIAGRVTEPDEQDNDDPLVYQSCKISINGVFSREEVIGQLTPAIEARVASPGQFLGPNEPWIYSESTWTEANEMGESFYCYQVTRAPNPNAR